MLGWLVSASVAVPVDDAAEEAFAADVNAVDGRLTGPGQRRLLPERLVRPMLIVVGGGGVQDGPQRRSPAIRIRSVPSRRTVATQRSA
jgi:hypothetical protein